MLDFESTKKIIFEWPADIVDGLIKKKLIDIHSKSESGDTLLHASYFPQVQFDLLLDNGFELTAKNKEDEFFINEGNSSNLVKYLNDKDKGIKIDQSVTDKDGNNFLQRCARVSLCLAGRLLGVASKEFRVNLHRGRATLMKLYINHKNNKGHTILHILTKSGTIDAGCFGYEVTLASVITKIVALGGDPFARDNSGKTHYEYISEQNLLKQPEYYGFTQAVLLKKITDFESILRDNEAKFIKIREILWAAPSVATVTENKKEIDSLLSDGSDLD